MNAAIARVLVTTVGIVGSIGVAGCTADSDEPAEPAGMLTATDLPFEPTSEYPGRPHPLTQLGSSCVGIEQGVLYDDDWTVEAHTWSDYSAGLTTWYVTSAVFSPPADAADAGDGGTVDEALDVLRERVAECAPDDTGAATVTPRDVDGAGYSYEITDPEQAFDSARSYVALPDGGIAQISLTRKPADRDTVEVLEGLVAALT